jgi:hypothetical protein
VPRLRRLRLQSGSMTFGALALPALVELEVRTGGLTAENIADLARADWPALERLTLWFGDAGYGASGGVAEIAPILDGARLPSLRHLGLMNAEFTDELCAMLHRTKILPRLKTLDLSMGIMSDVGAESLAANSAAYAHLESLSVAQNYLTDAGLARVAGLCREVKTEDQKRPYREGADRYVSVGE